MYNQHLFKSYSNRYFRGTTFLLFCFFFSFGIANAQEQSLSNLITQKDATFWKAYNTCDISGMNAYLAEDIEFYHDKGGITKGRKNLNDGLRQGLCKSGKNRLRREAVPGSVTIFPLKDKDTVYGAIITGEHLFYIAEGESNTPEGQAKFSHLWLKENGDWKMHRVFSFDHRPVSFHNPKKPIELKDKELKELTGQYLTASNDSITVKFNGDNLVLQAMGKTFILYPESKNTFFTKERDLSFSFTNKGLRKLTIFESDNKVAEAILH